MSIFIFFLIMVKPSFSSKSIGYGLEENGIIDPVKPRSFVACKCCTANTLLPAL